MRTAVWKPNENANLGLLSRRAYRMGPSGWEDPRMSPYNNVIILTCKRCFLVVASTRNMFEVKRCPHTNQVGDSATSKLQKQMCRIPGVQPLSTVPPDMPINWLGPDPARIMLDFKKWTRNITCLQAGVVNCGGAKPNKHHIRVMRQTSVSCPPTVPVVM
jgi:hypothetical protein